MAGLSSINEDQKIEFDALMAIYEKELRIQTEDDYLSYQIELQVINAVLAITVADQYPKVPPVVTVKTSENHIVELEEILKTISDTLRGEVMVHSLIEEARKWARESGYSKDQKKQKSKNECEVPVCKFFLEGKCKFGDTCFNSHLTTGKEDNGENSTQRKGNSEKTTSTKLSSHPSVTNVSGSTKKAPMKTATDVISRILWDEKIDPNNFCIGYLDRFVGIVEQPFSEFSWEDIASVDHNVLSIPKHRIQYFKYCGDIVWDKRERFDNVFGSTGSGCTILEVMESGRTKEQDWRKGKSEEQKDLSRNNLKDDNKDCCHSNTTEPNYFIAFQVQDSRVLEKIDEVHKEIILMQNCMSEGIIPPQKMHVTLLMLTIENDKELTLVKDILKGLHHALPSLLPLSNKLTFKGVGSFKDRILYVTTEGVTELQRWVDILKQEFRIAGINLDGNRENFLPHLTVVRTPSRISPTTSRATFERVETLYQDVIFGHRSLNEVILFSRFDSKDENGLHHKVLTLGNSLLSVLPTLRKKILTYIEDLYKMDTINLELRQKINCLIETGCHSGFEEALSLLEEVAREGEQQDGGRLIVILRGIPGSGKTFLAQNCLEAKELQSLTICSSKQLFHRLGNSKMDQSELNIAAAYCRGAFLEALTSKVSLIVIDDCHVYRWQYAFYQRLARVFRVPSRVLQISCLDRDGILECHKYVESATTCEDLLNAAQNMEEDTEALCIAPWFQNPTLRRAQSDIILRDFFTKPLE